MYGLFSTNVVEIVTITARKTDRNVSYFTSCNDTESRYSSISLYVRTTAAADDSAGRIISHRRLGYSICIPMIS